MTRRLTIKDIKDLRLLLFGKGGRGLFEVRTSPEDDGSDEGGDHTADANLWDATGAGEPKHDDLDFSVCSFETSARNRMGWPNVYEGISFDLYVRVPDLPNDMRDDWDLWGNTQVTLENGVWKINKDSYGPIGPWSSERMSA